MPSATKAATLTPEREIVHVPLADIAKWEDGPDGSLYVYGRATTPEIDTDEQVVSGEWSGKALQSWLETAPALRVQHNGQRDPAGSGVRVEVNRDGDGAHWVKGVVDEPVAQRLVRKGHLRAFSVGIRAPVIERDMTGKARGGIISGGRIVEVSLVDSPANRSCFLEMAKADKNGDPEWTGELTAPDDVLAKVAEPDKSKTVTIELPKNMSLSVKPSDLAKLATFKQRLTTEKATAPPVITKVTEPDAAKAVTDADDAELTAIKAAEAEVYKRDIDTATRRRLAGEDKALPNLSYPIENTGDLANAAHLARTGHGDAAGAKRLIARRARELGVPNPLKGGKGKKGKTTKAAEPQVTKCGMCGGSGMAEAKPCPECKKGRKRGKRGKRMEKAAVREALALVAGPGAQKKRKVMCPNCGAKQNVKHAHCPECGKPLPASAPPVVKNHDFRCLGCGHDPLDKGEKHCPDCGKENPGYNPMADHKIPANKAAKPGKERVKKPKRGKKANATGGEGFGGKKAPPFGARDEPGEDGKKPPKAEKRRKGKKGKPTPGDAVPGEHTMPVPAHREPDGPAIERFEDDSGLQEGDEHAEMAAAMRHKSLASTGLSRGDALLHDLTCPAFSPDSLVKAFPFSTLATVNTDAWQARALDAAATAELSQAGKAMALWQNAVTLKGADPELVHDLRAEAHQAFCKANKGALKAFRDAAPGPGSFPTPGHVTPQQFRRPYLSEGHAAPSPQHGAPHSFGVPEGQPSAQDYTRGLITEGHAADSPQNDTPRHEPQPAPATPGQPDRVYYRGTMRDNARQAMTAMHDHIARVFPDVCPMSPELGSTQKPAPQVPEGVGGPAPRRSAKAQKAAARKKAKAVRIKRRRREKRLVTKVMNGKMTINKARKALGIKADQGLRVLPVPPPDAAAAPALTPLDPDVIKTVVTEANAPLLERIAAQDKALRKQRKAIDAIASQPDTSQAPLRGAALTKTAAPPAGALSVARSAEQAQSAQLQMLHHEWRTNSDPAQREAAYRALTTQLGINPMTSPQT